MKDTVLLLLAMEVAFVLVSGVWLWLRHRKFQVLRWASRQLKPVREHLEAQEKTLAQHEAWNPRDPNTAFLRMHLNWRIKQHNRIAQRIEEEAKK